MYIAPKSTKESRAHSPGDLMWHIMPVKIAPALSQQVLFGVPTPVAHPGVLTWKEGQLSKSWRANNSM